MFPARPTVAWLERITNQTERMIAAAAYTLARSLLRRYVTVECACANIQVAEISRYTYWLQLVGFLKDVTYFLGSVHH
jgi:hypothetical protein